jgi:Kef-type K+ transport system membrane component KefB
VLFPVQGKNTLILEGLTTLAIALFLLVAGMEVDLFAIILGMIGSHAGHGWDIGATIGLTLGFTAVGLTLGRWLIHRVLPWIKAHTSWPGGILGLALSLAFFGAACTEYIGIHAIFGAFLVGIAIGDSSHLREQTRTVISQFISFIFAHSSLPASACESISPPISISC